MLTLLAESKTMTTHLSPVSAEALQLHIPAFEDVADDIMSYLEALPVADLAEALGISGSLAVKAHALAYDFPHKQTGCDALHAFTGDAYRGLDINSVPEELCATADSSLRIISSMYGVLKPSDIIKPYRCEFNKPISSDHKTAIQLFRQRTTVYMVNLIKERKTADIIDLLPADADKCIDWKIVRAFAKVHKVVFQSMMPDGRLKTPIAKRLKELRGTMYREILTKGISSFQELTEVKSESFIYSPADSKPGLPVFITD